MFQEQQSTHTLMHFVKDVCFFSSERITLKMLWFVYSNVLQAASVPYRQFKILSHSRNNIGSSKLDKSFLKLLVYNDDSFSSSEKLLLIKLLYHKQTAPFTDLFILATLSAWITLFFLLILLLFISPHQFHKISHKIYFILASIKRITKFQYS